MERGKVRSPFRAIHEGGLPRPEGLGYYLLPLRGKIPPFTSHLSHPQTVGILNWLVPPCVSTLLGVFSYQRCMMLLYRV
jgi:hypothetical protein